MTARRQTIFFSDKRYKSFYRFPILHEYFNIDNDLKHECRAKRVDDNNTYTSPVIYYEKSNTTPSDFVTVHNNF